MKTSLRVISLCAATMLVMAGGSAPALAQAAEKVQAKPQETTGRVGDLTFKRGLLAKPTNTKEEAWTLVEQMRIASADLKDLADQNERPMTRRRTGEKPERQPSEAKRTSERLRHKERAAGHRKSIGKIRAVARELDAEILKWEEQISSVGDDAQLANIDLQNALQKQQQLLQTMSNVSKMLHDTAMAIIRKIG